MVYIKRFFFIQKSLDIFFPNELKKRINLRKTTRRYTTINERNNDDFENDDAFMQEEEDDDDWRKRRKRKRWSFVAVVLEKNFTNEKQKKDDCKSSR